MKNFKHFLLCFSIACIAITAIIYSSCKKDPCSGVSCQNGGSCNNGNCVCSAGYNGTKCENMNISNVVYKNNTPTTITIVAAGTTYTVSSGQTISFAGHYTETFAGAATTSGATGLTVSWTLADPFPTDGDKTVNLDVSSNYFYLIIQNNSIYNVTGLRVNIALSSQSNETVSLIDGTWGMGYYDAYSNTSIQAANSVGYWSTAYPAFSFILDQTFTYVLN